MNKLPVIIFICLGIIIYSNTFNSSFHLDDINSIVINPRIRDITDLKAIWQFWPTRFITYLSIVLNYHFNKLDVFGYHLFNLTVHICSTILVWWLALLTLAKTKHAHYIAFFSGLIFLTHPIQTQGVTYIIQRAISLSTLFYLLSLCLYIKSNKVFYILSILTAILAMYTKETAITIPFIILLYRSFFLKTKKRLTLIPFFIILSTIPLTMFLTRSIDLQKMCRASEIPPGISPIHYLLTQFRVMVTYIRCLFIPFKQNLDYDYHISKSLFELPTLTSLYILIVILAIAIKIKNNYLLVSFCIFWFFITLLPESSIIPIKDVIFEHRLYLPMAGFSLFLTSTIYYIFKKNKIALYFILLAIVSWYSVLTYKRNLVWKDEFTLWNDVVSKSPGKARGYNGRGFANLNRGSIDSAIIDFNKALEIDPTNPEYYSNRGTAYLTKGNPYQAMADYKKAIEINPEMAGLYNNLGNIYHTMGGFDEAIIYYTKALEIDPNYMEVYNNRGNAHQDKGNFDKAITDYNKAIEINPDYADAYNNRGNVYQNKGDFKQAIADYNKVIEINPYFAVAYNNRGNAYSRIGYKEQSLWDYNKAIEINPHYAEAYYNRGNIYLNIGNYDKAIADYTKAIEINPSYAAAYNNRGNAYKMKGNLDQAIADYNKAKDYKH